MTELKLNAL